MATKCDTGLIGEGRHKWLSVPLQRKGLLAALDTSTLDDP